MLLVRIVELLTPLLQLGGYDSNPSQRTWVETIVIISVMLKELEAGNKMKWWVTGNCVFLLLFIIYYWLGLILPNVSPAFLNQEPFDAENKLSWEIEECLSACQLCLVCVSASPAVAWPLTPSVLFAFNAAEGPQPWKHPIDLHIYQCSVWEARLGHCCFVSTAFSHRS